MNIVTMMSKATSCLLTLKTYKEIGPDKVGYNLSFAALIAMKPRHNNMKA